MFAEIITIGDEILIGQIVDTNSAWMAKELNQIGMRVKQISSVSDEKQHILNAIKEAEQRADVILITGGLGPTKDDITKHTLNEYFKGNLISNAEALANVHRIFKRFNRPVLEVNIKQAEVPDNCEVILNLNGTAPGMYFHKNGKHYFSMPGVPFEMMGMMENDVLKMIQSKLKMPFIQHETILTAGIGESFLAEEISEIEESLPNHIKLAYLPKLGQVRLRLSGYAENKEELSSDLLKYKEQIVTKCKKFVVAEQDISIEEAILQLLAKEGKTLSTAESCTGGYIGHLLTSIPGSSKNYLGGGVTYSYELKESVLGVNHDTLIQFGAVSEETVKEMALGALKAFNSDYSIACSGIAGPDGGTLEKPVGTVWVAIANKKQVITHKYSFGNKRMQNIERTAVSAFYMLYRLMKAN